MLKLMSAAALSVLMLTVHHANAAETATVKVALLDMTALLGGEASSSSNYGPGMMGWAGPGYGPGLMGPGGQGMMGQGGQGMMGQGGQGYGYGPGRGYGMMGQGMMGMMSIRTNVSAVKAGNIAFDIANLSRSIVHEVLVVAVDNPNAPLPYDFNAAEVPEKQIKVIGEMEDMEPNAEKTLDLDLKPGSYLLICNLPGHYAAGMWTALTVNQ